MNSKEIIQSGLLELYALGQCSEQEKAIVENALVADETVRRELNEINAAIEAYATTNAVAPPTKLKAQIFDQIADLDVQQVHLPEAQPVAGKVQEVPVAANRLIEKKEIPVRKLDNSPWKWLAAASVILLVGSAALNYVYYNRWQGAEDRIASIEQERLLLSDENGILKARMQNGGDQYAFLSKTTVVMATLKAQDKFPGAEARVFWDKASEDLYLLSSNLQPLQEGQQYQLWAIVDGEPVDAGMVLMEDGETLHKMKQIAHAQAFAITIEKEGGAQVPTMEQMVVMGNI